MKRLAIALVGGVAMALVAVGTHPAADRPSADASHQPMVGAARARPDESGRGQGPLSRFGWVMLALIVIVVGGFLSMLSFGPGEVVVPDVAAPPDRRRRAVRRRWQCRSPITRFPRSTTTGAIRARGKRKHQGLDLMARRNARRRRAVRHGREAVRQRSRWSHPIYPFARPPLDTLLCPPQRLCAGAGRRAVGQAGAGRRLCRRHRQCGGGQHASAFRGQLDARRGRLVSGRAS